MPAEPFARDPAVFIVEDNVAVRNSPGLLALQERLIKMISSFHAPWALDFLLEPLMVKGRQE